MSLKFTTTPSFSGERQKRYLKALINATAWGRRYDVAPDGRRFLVTLREEAPTNLAAAQMIFVQHWFEELKRLVPTH